MAQEYKENVGRQIIRAKRFLLHPVGLNHLDLALDKSAANGLQKRSLPHSVGPFDE